MDTAALNAYRQLCDVAAMRGDHLRLTISRPVKPDATPRLDTLAIHNAAGERLHNAKLGLSGLTGAVADLNRAYLADLTVDPAELPPHED